MNKTKIEWCDATINPVKGLCPVGCSYCYARAMYKRFKWNPEIRYDADWWQAIRRVHNKRVFMGSTFELFGDFVPNGTLERIFKWVRIFKDITFIFLTKKPENLIKWSPFPDNCWVGVSVTDDMKYTYATHYLETVKAAVKFISFEPLLTAIDCNKPWDKRLGLSGINWLIIGQQTPVHPKTMPKIEWIREIVEAADKAGIPIFLKDNLRSALTQDSLNPYPVWAFKDGYYTSEENPFIDLSLRQEFPKVKS